MSSSPSKKRKANDDGRRAAMPDSAKDVSTNNNNNYSNDGGGFLSSWLSYFPRRRKITPSVPSCDDNLSQKMDTMMQIMVGMQEKLISVESRCEQLEAKCSSLENIIGTKIDSLQHRMEEHHTKEHKILNYHEMLIKNQHWKYSAPTYSAEQHVMFGFDEVEARYLESTSYALKELTETMRRGEFNAEDCIMRNDRGISWTSNFDDGDFPLGTSGDVDERLYSHWREFAEALEQFAPALGALPDECVSFLQLNELQLNNDAIRKLLKKAVMNTPFQALDFYRNRGMSINDILDIVHINEHVQKLDISENPVGMEYIERICSTIHGHSTLVDFDMGYCLENNGVVGDVMMISLLTYGNLKLQRLVMSHNGITSNVITQLSEFLANDPPMKWLELEGNRLTDTDAELLADALRSNSSLRHLNLKRNIGINDVGCEAFYPVLYDESTLNAVSDSNHSCCVQIGDYRPCNAGRPWDMIRTWDMKDSREEVAMNRAQKIYRLLSSRNQLMSNVQHFDDIDVKILPNMIEAVHRCRSLVEEFGFDIDVHVNSLSIVYEVMRKWEKVFPFYNLEGGNIDPQQRETHNSHSD